MISVKLNGYNVPLEHFTFPGGEEHIKIEPSTGASPKDISVYALLRNSSDLIALLLTVDAARRISHPHARLELHLPYLPYARQDRVAVRGESLSLKVIANTINSLKADEVILCDVHSDVGLALINNVTHRSQQHCMERYSVHLFNNCMKGWYTLVAPDLGASKKTAALAKTFNMESFIQATKDRDPQTGQLSNPTVLTDNIEKGLDMLIVDDICDGGGTFLMLADKLEEFSPNSISLYTTHGIYSKGKQILTSKLTRVYSAFDWETTP